MINTTTIDDNKDNIKINNINDIDKNNTNIISMNMCDINMNENILLNKDYNDLPRTFILSCDTFGGYKTIVNVNLYNSNQEVINVMLERLEHILKNNFF